VLDEYTDPINSSGGGASKNGSDPRPNAEKLFDIGRRIRRLEEEFKSASTNSSTTSKIEVNKRKNMLASRICRLKKKAYHEANKIKLGGLREEHGECLINFVNNY